MRLPDKPDSLPGCIGESVPIGSNQCEGCQFTDLCEFIQGKFVPKKRVREATEKIEAAVLRIEALLPKS